MLSVSDSNNDCRNNSNNVSRNNSNNMSLNNSNNVSTDNSDDDENYDGNNNNNNDNNNNNKGKKYDEINKINLDIKINTVVHSQELQKKINAIRRYIYMHICVYYVCMCVYV
jgi:hypothetical protein